MERRSSPRSAPGRRWQLRTLVEIILSTPRVFQSGCCKARFAGNSGAIAKKCNAAAGAEEQPTVKIILTRALMVASMVAIRWWISR